MNFFEGRSEYPKFHKRHSKQSATYAANAFTWEDATLTLAKMNEPLAIRWSRPLPDGCKPSSVTISKDGAERYFVSFLIEQEIETLPVVVQTIGADLGLKSFVALSNGETIGNPTFFRADEKRLARAQRKHARKKKGSKNKNKARGKVAKVHARIADRRRDFQHKLSTRLIHENQVLPFSQMSEARSDSFVSGCIRRTICVESLAVKNMVKNHCLAKSISDMGWGEFVHQLEYKAAWYGRALVKIDRWYPSSKRCFACGHILESLSLDEREWTCPECQVHHDRDLNASQNIHAAGLAVYACGESVRPAAVKTAAGNSRRNRKPSQQ